MSDEEHPAPSGGQRQIGEAPWCWQTKASLRRIREACDNNSYLDQSLAVYAVLCELASDAQSDTFQATRRKIAALSGVCVRRVSDILALLKSVNLLYWKQNFIEGTKELAPSTYTLMSCTPCTTSSTLCTRLGTDAVSEKCTVVKQSPEKSPEKSCSTKARKLSGLQKELADRIEATLGVEWVNDAGKWVNRIKILPGKSERVIAEVENAVKEERIKKSTAQYAEHIWKEFSE